MEGYIDPSLSYEENIKLMKRQFKLGGGRSRQKAARGLSAAECDVAIGNYEAGYNGEEMRDACLCGHPDACVDLERAKRAAKPVKKAAAKPEVTLKTIGGRFHLCSGKSKPVEILQEDAYEFVCDKVRKDFAGKRVSNKKLREYADKHGFYGGWVESAYDTIKPSRSIKSIERDIKKVDEKAYKRSKASHALGGTRPGGGALDRDMQRIWQQGDILKSELERAKQQQTAAAPKAAAKPAKKPTQNELTRARELGKAGYWAGKQAPAQDAKILDMCRQRSHDAMMALMTAWGKGWHAEHQKETDKELLGKGIIIPGMEAAPKPPQTPAPSVPAILAPAPAAPVLPDVPMGLGGGIPPIPGVEPPAAVPPALAPAVKRRQPAAKPAAKPRAKKVATPKPKSKAKKTAAKPAKPKAKKTAPELTTAQRKRLAATGRVTVKRGGKFVTVTR